MHYMSRHDGMTWGVTYVFSACSVKFAITDSAMATCRATNLTGDILFRMPAFRRVTNVGAVTAATLMGR